MLEVGNADREGSAFSFDNGSYHGIHSERIESEPIVARSAKNWTCSFLLCNDKMYSSGR
jgi:hypothetical protein